jgi:hypothetical protein
MEHVCNPPTPAVGVSDQSVTDCWMPDAIDCRMPDAGCRQPLIDLAPICPICVNMYAHIRIPKDSHDSRLCPAPPSPHACEYVRIPRNPTDFYDFVNVSGEGQGLLTLPDILDPKACEYVRIRPAS